MIAAADPFLAVSGYPLDSAAGRLYALARAAVSPDGGDLLAEPVYREGRKLRIEDAVVLALHAG